MPRKAGNIGARHPRLHERVKTARGRKLSSTRWLERQLNDPYVRRARAEGYRGRAAYKLIELDDRFRLSAAGRAQIVDLGAAPGGWCQVAVPRVNADGAAGGQAAAVRVIGVDLQEIEPIAGAELHVLDFLAEGADDQVKVLAGRTSRCGDVGHGRRILRPQADRPSADCGAVRGRGGELAFDVLEARGNLCRQGAGRRRRGRIAGRR
jgi:23S rRNA (uridine2552-2'-O)-methyltransferase